MTQSRIKYILFKDIRWKPENDMEQGIVTSEPYSLLSHSDKSFWHGYLSFYESHLPRNIEGLIVEFGVFKGNSIRWLSQKYPEAKIEKKG